MQNQLYILHQLIFPYFKIGSTQNFEKRVDNFVTGCPHFDNISHIILFTTYHHFYNSCSLNLFKYLVHKSKILKIKHLDRYILKTH